MVNLQRHYMYLERIRRLRHTFILFFIIMFLTASPLNSITSLSNYSNNLKNANSSLTLARDKQPNGSLIPFNGTNYFEYENRSRFDNETYMYPNGDWYEGDLLNGKKHGFGLYHWVNGDEYEGDWVSDLQEGYGSFNRFNGESFNGSWLNGKKHGLGKYTWTDFSEYYGEWVEDVRSGFGKLKYLGGEWYEGDWLNDTKQGNGTYHWMSFSLNMFTALKRDYNGAWDKGVQMGYGKMAYTNGDWYEGNWLNNMKQGKGKYHWKDGEFVEFEELNINMIKNKYVEYVGDWSNGARTGFGEMEYFDGEWYKGNWLNNTMHGTGVYHWSNGAEHVGKWENNIRISVHDTDYDVVVSSYCKYYLAEPSPVKSNNLGQWSDINLLIQCKDFGLFSELQKFAVVWKDPNIPIPKDYKTTTMIQFYPQPAAILIGNLGINLVANATIQIALSTVLFNLKGIDIIFQQFTNVTYTSMPQRISILYSNLDFYYQGVLIDDTNCGEFLLTDIIPNMFQSNTFGQHLMITFNTIKYSRNQCPFVFKHSRFYKITFGGLSDSIVRRNIFSFSQKWKNLSHNVSSSILNLQLHVYNYHLDDTLLDDTVFRSSDYIVLYSNLQHLFIFGQLRTVEKYIHVLGNLKKIEMHLENVRQFWHTSTEWIRWFNKGIYENSTIDDLIHSCGFFSCSFYFSIYPKMFLEVNEIEEKSFDRYTYPDEDFCIFHRAYQNLVFIYPRIDNKKVKCSCTLFWLEDVNQKFKLADLIFNPTCYNNFNSTHCNFNHLSQTCKIDNKVMSTVDDLKEAFQMSELILYLIILPITCFIAIILNVGSLLAVRSVQSTIRAKKDDPPKMYAYMEYNSLFNILYCCIFIFSPLSACIDPIGIFCSEIFQYQLVQYFKIIGINYLGTVFKICANLTGLAISMQRFTMNNSETSYTILVRFSMKKVRHVTSGIFLFSAVTSLAKCFEYQVNKYFYVAGFPNEVTLIYSDIFDYILFTFSPDTSEFDKQHHQLYRYTINDRTTWKMLLLQVCLISIHFMNDFLILFVTLAIDAALCFTIRKNMVKTLKTSSTKNIKMKNRAATNVAKMVLINGCFYVSLRMFELVFNVINPLAVFKGEAIFRNQLTHFWLMSRSSLRNVCDCLYTLTFILPIFIYYRFNKQIRTEMRTYFKLVSGKNNLPP